MKALSVGSLYMNGGASGKAAIMSSLLVGQFPVLVVLYQ